MLAFIIFDPMYLLFLAPALLLGAWAQMKVKSAYAHAMQMPARSGLSGAEAAAHIMRAHGLNSVTIEPTRGFLGDHYDPRGKVLRLSPEVYQGRSLAALGIAAHEAGHAIQDAAGYAPLGLRNAIVPMASFGGNLTWILVIAGLFLHLTGLIWAGIVLFSVVVLFQLVNLPVEFNASRRARQVLLANGMITQQEDPAVGKVLNAAALTYVAATLTAILQLAYLLTLANRR